MDEEKFGVEVKNLAGYEDVKLLSIVGILDHLTVEDADKIIGSLVEKEGMCLVVDCSRLAYVNSTGLATLMRYYIQARRRKGSFKIVAPTKYVYEIMDVSGAIKLLEIYKTQEEAIDSWIKK